MRTITKLGDSEYDNENPKLRNDIYLRDEIHAALKRDKAPEDRTVILGRYPNPAEQPPVVEEPEVTKANKKDLSKRGIKK